MPTVYLSPSLQEFNQYVNGGNEEQMMNLIVDAMIPYLRASGIQYVRNSTEQSLLEAIAQSNAGNYDLHVAIHSNASPESLSGQLQGTDVYYRPGNWSSKRFADILVRNFKQIYPNPQMVQALPTSSLAEVRRTTAPAVLIEVAYHDNWQDAQWIKDNIDAIARTIVRAMTEYFGIPFVEPQPERVGIVQTGGPNLNIRNRPNTGAAVIGRIPDGAQITVYSDIGEWDVVGYGGVVGFAYNRYINLQ